MTESAGDWFLSYLCDIGYIQNDDIFDGSICGKVTSQFLEKVPNGSYVYIKIDEKDPFLFHVTYILPENYSGMIESDDPLEDEKLNPQKLSFRIGLSFTII